LIDFYDECILKINKICGIQVSNSKLIPTFAPSKMNKKVAFYTLGCKLNYSETSSIGRLFNKAGFETVDFSDTPDIFVINTCSVTDHADKKCRKVVKEALKISPNAYVTIVGCYAQLKPTEIAEISGRGYGFGRCREISDR